MPSMLRFVLAALVSAIAAARDVYVSSETGSDAQSGDREHPWRSLSRLGQDPTLTGGDTIHLRGSWSEPLVLIGEGGGCAGNMRGAIDFVNITSTQAQLGGWVVDPTLPGNGTGPVAIRIAVDGNRIVDMVANLSRPDLPKAGVAPNADHGFTVALSANVVKLLQTGTHRIQILASGAAAHCGEYAWPIPATQSTTCVCNGTPCVCPPFPSAPVLRVLSADGAAGARPSISLNGTGVAMAINGFDSVHIQGIEVAHATKGITVSANSAVKNGTAQIQDCVFRSVWNRTYIGQHAGGAPPEAHCSNGWTAAIRAGNFGLLSVSHCVFDDIDVALQPLGALGAVRFTSNTVTRANGNTLFMVGKTEWLISESVFSRDYAPRYFPCGTTDIMVGQLGTTGAISENEIGWRGEHPAAPDGCGIDFEGGSGGVSVMDNVIHDSYGAGVMVYGMSDKARNISNASILRNIFVRNGVQQTSEDRGEIAFMEPGSTGTCADNVFYSDDPSSAFVFHESHQGILASGWQLSNNTVHPVSDIAKMIADTPAVQGIVFDAKGQAQVSVKSHYNPERNTSVIWSTDGSWPRLGAAGTTLTPIGIGQEAAITVPRTSALNARFLVDGLLPSLTMTLIVDIPATSQLHGQ